jgi:hypothetical protein
MRIRTVCALLPLAVMALPGCLSETPIVPGAPAPIDERLLGAWRCVSPEANEEATTTLTLRRRDATSYAGTMAESPEKASGFEAHVVGKGDGALVNVKDTDTESKESWTVVRYALLRPDVLHLDMADYDAYQKAGKDAPVALRDPKRRETLLRDWCTCVRVRAGS